MGKTTIKKSVYFVLKEEVTFFLCHSIFFDVKQQHWDKCPSYLLPVSNLHDPMKHDFPLERNTFPFFTNIVILNVLFCNLSQLLVTFFCDAVFDFSFFSGD